MEKNEVEEATLVLVAMSDDWSTAFAVESTHGEMIAYVLNDTESGHAPPWMVITDPFPARELDKVIKEITAL